MTAHTLELEPRQPLGKSFFASAGLHVGITALLFSSALWQARQRDLFGDPNPGFGPATIETVSSIPLPSRPAQPNPVANDTESLAPAKAKPAPAKRVLDPDDPDAIALRREKEKKKKLTREQLREMAMQRYQSQPQQPNQVTSSTGAAMSNPMYSIKGGGGQLGLGSTNPFGTRLGWYADLIRQRVGEKWRTQDVPPSVQSAPILSVSFRILRNGEVRDLRLLRSGGNYLLDQSAMRAIQEASPLPALPREFERDVANVEFQFQFRR